MARAALRIQVSTKDQKELQGFLSGGVQQVHVVLRALALWQLAKGVSAPRISGTIPLTPQAIRKVGHRYQEGGLERALYERPRRCGTANVFCAVEPKLGRHFTFATPDRSGFEFAQVAVNLALAYPTAKTIHLVMDNLNIHSRKSLAAVFGAEMATEVWDRFTIHYTPTHGSWLNQAEIEIGIFTRQCMGKRRIPDLKILRREAKSWNRRMNRNRLKIAWKFDRKTARRKFRYKRNTFKRS
jgi:DDE superfamily endonuclease